MENLVQNGIINSEELLVLLSNNSNSLAILDASFVLPTSPLNPKLAFQRERIGNAQFFDLGLIADQDSSLPHMLPSAQEFENAASALGVSNDSLIVIYAQDGMVMGPARAWWMFRIFGHEHVCVLNGGLPSWKNAGFEVNTPPPTPTEKGEFSAVFQPNLVVDMEQMKDFSQNGSAQILDARPKDRFYGEVPEPRSGMRAGHIPGSFNCPASNLIDSNTGKIKSQKSICSALSEQGLNPELPIVTTCGSGITACFLALALFSIGYNNIPVYDGSWSEWGDESKGTPIS